MKLAALLAAAAFGVYFTPQGTSSDCTSSGCKWTSGIEYSHLATGSPSSTGYAETTTCSVNALDGSCCCNAAGTCVEDNAGCFATVTYSFTYRVAREQVGSETFQVSNGGPATLQASVAGCGTYDSESALMWHVSYVIDPPLGLNPRPTYKSVVVWASCSTCDYLCESVAGSGGGN